MFRHQDQTSPSLCLYCCFFSFLRHFLIDQFSPVLVVNIFYWLINFLWSSSVLLIDQFSAVVFIAADIFSSCSAACRAWRRVWRWTSTLTSTTSVCFSIITSTRARTKAAAPFEPRWVFFSCALSKVACPACDFIGGRGEEGEGSKVLNSPYLPQSTYSRGVAQGVLRGVRF